MKIYLVVLGLSNGGQVGIPYLADDFSDAIAKANQIMDDGPEHNEGVGDLLTYTIIKSISENGWVEIITLK
jgi:hypothetical protein